jgi:hypothetical protein
LRDREKWFLSAGELFRPPRPEETIGPGVGGAESEKGDIDKAAFGIYHPAFLIAWA